MLYFLQFQTYTTTPSGPRIMSYSSTGISSPEMVSKSGGTCWSRCAHLLEERDLRRYSGRSVLAQRADRRRSHCTHLPPSVSAVSGNKGIIQQRQRAKRRAASETEKISLVTIIKSLLYIYIHHRIMTFDTYTYLYVLYFNAP
jgi:hypothetical protein